MLWSVVRASGDCLDEGLYAWRFVGAGRYRCVVVRCFGLGSGGLLRVRCGVLVGVRHPPGRGVSPGGLGDPG